MAKKKKSFLQHVFDNVTTVPRGLGALVQHFAETNNPATGYMGRSTDGSAFPEATAGLPLAGSMPSLPPGMDVGNGPIPSVPGLTAPTEAAAATGPDPVDTWLQQALASLGGGPDRNAYIAPFDAATARANEAHAAALPVIAQQYDALRGQLGQNQQGYQQQVANTQAAQAQAQQGNQQLLQNLQAPVLADLQAQGGQAAVGSLTGALQAQMAAGQAGVAGTALAQKQLSDNLANSANQSFNGRMEDSRLAETAAQGNASANLNSILNQIGLQRAGAEQQYNSAAQQFAQQRAGLQLQALQARQAQDDPMKVLQVQKAMLENQKLQNDLTPDTSANDALQAWHLDISERSPVAYDYLTEVLGNSDSLAQALAQINRDAKGGTKIKYNGKSLDVATLRQWATEAARLEAASTKTK